MKVLSVIPAEAGIQTAFAGIPPEACGNDGLAT